jgi:DAN domain.
MLIWLRFYFLVLSVLINTKNSSSRAWRSKSIPLNEEHSSNSVAIDTDMNYSPGRCIPITFNQTVTKRGCLPVVIRNNLCFGTCGSMYIPRGNPMDFNTTRRETFFDCRHCIPSKYQLIRLPMYCPGRKRKHRTKRVLLIHDCSCSSRTCFFHNGIRK